MIKSVVVVFIGVAKISLYNQNTLKISKSLMRFIFRTFMILSSQIWYDHGSDHQTVVVVGKAHWIHFRRSSLAHRKPESRERKKFLIPGARVGLLSSQVSVLDRPERDTEGESEGGKEAIEGESIFMEFTESDHKSGHAWIRAMRRIANKVSWVNAAQVRSIY